MKKLLALIAVCVAAVSCTPAASPGPSQAQQDAAAVVKALNDAWEASATSCTAAEDAGFLAKDSCGPVFVPIYDSIVLASNAVDTWTAANQEVLPCLVNQIMVDLMSGQKLLTDAHVSIPQQVLTAESAVQAFVGSLCVDGGK